MWKERKTASKTIRTSQIHGYFVYLIFYLYAPIFLRFARRKKKNYIAKDDKMISVSLQI